MWQGSTSDLKSVRVPGVQMFKLVLRFMVDSQIYEREVDDKQQQLECTKVNREPNTFEKLKILLCASNRVKKFASGQESDLQGPNLIEEHGL